MEWRGGRLQWAQHEAGHATAMYVLGVPFTRIVAWEGERRVEAAPIPELEGLSLCVPTDLDEARAVSWVKVPEARRHVETSLVTYAAGPVSQMILGGKEAPADIDEFYLYGGPKDAAIIRGYALALAAWGKEKHDAILEARGQLARAAVAEAVPIVEDHLEAITALANRIEVEGELSGGAAVRLLRNRGVMVRGA